VESVIFGTPPLKILCGHVTVDLHGSTLGEF